MCSFMALFHGRKRKQSRQWLFITKQADSDMFLPAVYYTVYDKRRSGEKKKEAMWVIDLLRAPLRSCNKGEPLCNKYTSLTVEKIML